MPDLRERPPISPRLAGAIVAAFGQEDANTVRESLVPDGEREWLRDRRWLHNSGLALYFLARARRLGIEDVMPQRILRGLEENLADNRVRTSALLDEFVRVNMEFQRARLSYANVKGFSHAPRSCSDPAYRYQHDLDFLVSRSDAERCRAVLERLGYRLAAEKPNDWEFVAGAGEVLTMRRTVCTGCVEDAPSQISRFTSPHKMSRANRDLYVDRLSRIPVTDVEWL